MTNESKDGDQKDKKPNKEKFDKLRDQIKETEKKKQAQNYQDAQTLIATREKIERDYVEDTIKITFNTSPQTKRTILARRPTNKEMITILRLSAEASKYEGSNDPDALIHMIEIYDQLGGIASNLSVDDNLDEEFWNDKVSFPALQDFITSLISLSQEVEGGVNEKEMENFR
jgi:hypothetical protein